MILRKGKQAGTIVTDYPIGEERQHMIEHYGGRLVASGMNDVDIEDIIQMNYTIESLWSEHYNNQISERN